MWKLTGVTAREYTNATTTGLVNARTGAFDGEIVRRLGLLEKLFPALRQPGTVVGEYKGIKVVLCATHDTASAVEGIPMDGQQLYIFSGTWSLLGVKSPAALTDEKSREANYSNESGVGYIRYQKNIMLIKSLAFCQRIRAKIENRSRSGDCKNPPVPTGMGGFFTLHEFVCLQKHANVLAKTQKECKEKLKRAIEENSKCESRVEK